MIDPTKSVLAAHPGFKIGQLSSWWKGVIGKHGRYNLFAFFLALPLDQEAFRYAKDYGNELNLLSGENCLILGLGKTEYKRFGEDLWANLIKSKDGQAHAVKVATLYNLDYNDLPLMIFFEEFNSSDYIVLSLKDLTAEEIGYKLRETFSVVRDAISHGKSPLKLIARISNKKRFKVAGRSMISGIRTTAKNTFEVAVKAWLDALIG